MADSHPRIAQVVLDTLDARRLAEFYRRLFGLEYRESDSPPPPGEPVVATRADLETQKQRALDLGATLRLDRSEDPDEPLYVFADPAGHPFCIFVSS